MSDLNFSNRNGFRITFRVTIFLGLLGTIVAGGWYAGGFSQEVESMKMEITRNTVGREIIAQGVINLQTKAAAVDATGRATQQRLNSIDATLRRIEGKIDMATLRYNPDQGSQQ